MGEYNNIIHFYTPSADFGYFSNFSRHSIFMKGKRWPTSEHYFQAQKFAGTPIEEKIRCAERPGDAAGLGRSRAYPLRTDWEEVKEAIMKEALMAKFTQHKDLKQKLLDTMGKTIVEHTERDAYWGDAHDGSGLNRLGYLLMVVRDELLGLPPPPDPLLQKAKVTEQLGEETNTTTTTNDESGTGPEEDEEEGSVGGVEPNNNRQFYPGPSAEEKKPTTRKSRGKRGGGSKAKEKRSVFRDADGSATLEKTTDVKGTVTVIGEGTVFSEKALPPQAKVVVYPKK